MRKNTTVQEITDALKTSGHKDAELTLEATGGEHAAATQISGVSPVEFSGPGDLVFLDKKTYVETVKARRPAAVVTSKALAELLREMTGVVVLVSPNVALSHALIKQRYAGRDFEHSGWSKIHPSSIVHETAELSEDVVVEPRAVIGARVKIAKNVRVMAGVVIENDCTIDEGTVLHPSCIVGYGTKLGKDVVVGSGSVLGSEGYGFAQDAKRKSYPIPQTGIVVLEDRVRVGANCCIDRATYRETRIHAGTKLDNLCHIAHNVEIGEDCLLTSMFCVAGSTKIGNRVIASGQSGVIDHITICDDAILLHRAGVTKDIDQPGAYAGLPTQPLGDYLKNSAVLRSAVELKKRITDLEEKSAKT
ncbi:UDP-3-O-(3-hydroxymyristoyl)glucosamine N-acyltransferase [soil metagenome]